MLRWLATAVIAAFLALAIFVPNTSLGRRGTERTIRSDAPDAVLAVGDVLPDVELVDLSGAPVRLADLRGQRVLLTFERSVDW